MVNINLKHVKMYPVINKFIVVNLRSTMTLFLHNQSRYKCQLLNSISQTAMKLYKN